MSAVDRWDHHVEPPRVIEAEQALLGAILHNAAAIDRAREIVRPEDFSEDIHRTLFEVMARKRDAGEPIDYKLVRFTVGNADLGQGVTAGEYAARLAANATTIDGAPGYARAIRDAAGMRAVLATAQDAVAAMTAGAITDPAEYAAQMVEALDEVAAARLSITTKRVSLGQAARMAIASSVEAYEGKVQRGAPYGIPRLDRMTLGMRPGQLIVLAGRPGMGKTAKAVAVAVNAARSGHGVYFVSLEMQAQELGERALAAYLFAQDSRHPLAYRDMAQGRLSSDLYARMQAASVDLDAYPLSIEQQAGLSFSQIVARARQVRAQFERRGFPLGVIVIDHLGLIRASRRYAGNRVHEITEITAGAKELAKEMGVAVLLLSQLNREIEKGGDDKRPQLHHLRDSGSIEQDADVVIGLYREAYYLARKPDPTPEDRARLFETEDVLEAEVLKQRGGPTGRLNLFCRIDCNAIADLAEGS